MLSLLLPFLLDRMAARVDHVFKKTELVLVRPVRSSLAKRTANYHGEHSSLPSLARKFTLTACLHVEPRLTLHTVFFTSSLRSFTKLKTSTTTTGTGKLSVRCLGRLREDLMIMRSEMVSQISSYMRRSLRSAPNSREPILISGNPCRVQCPCCATFPA